LPPAAQVAAWKSFRFQILSLGEGGESVAWESNNYPKPGGRNRAFTRTIKLSDRHGLDEGVYSNKVDAYDQSGALLTKPRPLVLANPEGPAENESEYFGQVVETIREMRHQGTSVLIASQDPLSVPRAVVELTSLLILHRMTSPQW
jgi:hypothetical protein